MFLYFDTTDGYLRFISSVGQMIVPYFWVVIFSGGLKNIAGQMTVPFFWVVIFLGRNWCSYFDTSTNYGTYIQPEKIITRKKGTVVQSKKEIHTNRKFGSHCFCKIKKLNKNFLKLKCDW